MTHDASEFVRFVKVAAEPKEEQKWVWYPALGLAAITGKPPAVG